MPRVSVCDVNETLLDVGALGPQFKQAFGDGRVLQDWFGTVLLYSEMATLAGPYADFASIGGAALDMMAAARGVTVSPTDRGRILQGMLMLPAHPDVRDGLQAMRDTWLRLVTLTNSAPAAVQQQLANAGLASFSSGRSPWTRFGASSRPQKRTVRSLTLSDFPSIVYGSSRHTRGMSSAHSVRAVPPRLWRDRGRSCTRSVQRRTSWDLISTTSRSRLSRPKLARPDLRSPLNRRLGGNATGVPMSSTGERCLTDSFSGVGLVWSVSPPYLRRRVRRETAKCAGRSPFGSRAATRRRIP